MNNNIILTGSHIILKNDGSEINCMNSENFEVLNNTNKINKVHMIYVDSKNNKSYNIYLRNNIISKTNNK